jgi:hypothetical protein
MLFVGTWMLVSCLDSAMTGDAIAASVGAASASTRSLLGMLCPFQDGWDEASIRRLSIAIDADKTASARLKFRGVLPHASLFATNAIWCGASNGLTSCRYDVSLQRTCAKRSSSNQKESTDSECHTCCTSAWPPTNLTLILPTSDDGWTKPSATDGPAANPTRKEPTQYEKPSAPALAKYDGTEEQLSLLPRAKGPGSDEGA